MRPSDCLALTRENLEMVECFLLLRHAGDKWVPLLAIPGVIAGLAASICLIISGLKGILAGPRPAPRNMPIASPDRVVRWMARRPAPNGDHSLKSPGPQHS